MRYPTVLFAASLSLIVGLSGCANQAPADGAGSAEGDAAPFAFVADPASDAMVGSTAFVRNSMGKCGAAPSLVRDGCGQAVNAVRGQVPMAGGLPAPDSLDVLGASFQESADSLVATLEVASLPENFADVAAQDGSTSGSWDICWIVNGDDEKGWECTYLIVRASESKPVAEAYYDRYTPECNDWWWCSWHVETLIEYGSPGKISFTIPRFLLGQGEAGDALGKPMAATAQCTFMTAPVQWFAQGPLNDQGGLYNQVCESADMTEEGQAFTFTTAATAWDPALDPLAAYEDHTSDASGRDDADILSLEIVETPQTITATVQMARVDESMADHVTDFAIGLPSNRVYEGGYDMVDGTVAAWAGYCDDADCNEWLEFTPEIAFVAGSPGWIQLTFQREDIGSPMQGDLVNLAYFAINPVTKVNPAVPGVVDLNARILERGDWTQTLPPQSLGMDTE